MCFCVTQHSNFKCKTCLQLEEESSIKLEVLGPDFMKYEITGKMKFKVKNEKLQKKMGDECEIVE